MVFLSSGLKTKDGIDRLISSEIKYGMFVKDKKDKAIRRAKQGVRCVAGIELE